MTQRLSCSLGEQWMMQGGVHECMIWVREKKNGDQASHHTCKGISLGIGESNGQWGRAMGVTGVKFSG